MSTQNPSLQKKSAARMAAVQCLYTVAITGEKPSTENQLAALKQDLKDNRAEQKLRVGTSVEPNYQLMETLLNGVAERKADIEARIDRVLSEKWKRERMSPLLLGILQCAVFEMLFGKEINPKIVIDEYTRLTRHFFAEEEADFIYGALSNLAQQHG